VNKELNEVQKKLAIFAKERDWDQFHSLKNLTMAMSVECSELMEILQWSEGATTRADLDEEKQKAFENELIDIFIYWLRISDKFEMNIEEAFERKFKENCKKYPADKVRGSSKKYTEY
jgi:dCTP diphosphatase